MKTKLTTFVASLFLLCSCTTGSQVKDTRDENRVAIYFLEYESIYEDLIDESYVMTNGMMFTAPIEMTGMFEGKLVENSSAPAAAIDEHDPRADNPVGLTQIHSIGTPAGPTYSTPIYVVVKFRGHMISFADESGKHGRLDGEYYYFSDETARWFERCILPMWKSTSRLLGEPRDRIQTLPLGKNPFRDSK